MRKTLGIFGGTFDPVHLGHLRLALELKQQLNLDEMRLLPCYLPPHRATPSVSAAQRVEMLRIALRDCTELQLDERELARAKPSYTYDTLCELRAEVGKEVSLCLCMGMDSFTTLDTWHRWQELIQLAHLVVVARPGWELPATGVVAELLNRHGAAEQQLLQSAAGAVVMVAPRLMPISATEIRQLIKEGKSPQFLLPDNVWHYIREQHLYS
jgi:nicotinate-nucleotide adenylyltransferase